MFTPLCDSGVEMFNWFKSKASKSPTAPAPAAATKDDASPQDRRTALIAEANKNAREAREAIGSENLDKLLQMIRDKHEGRDVSPAAQARKIIEKMDTEKIAEHLRYLRNEPPTKH